MTDLWNMKEMIQCATLGIPKGMKQCNFYFCNISSVRWTLKGLQYSIWLATRVLSNVSIGCVALVLNVLGTHLAIRCPAAAVFLMCVSNLASEDISTPSSLFFCLITVPAGVWYMGLSSVLPYLISSNLSPL